MKLAAVGSNCIDYYNNIDNGKAFPGGGPVNMAVYTVRLGGEAAYVGPVGNDSYGEIMIHAIKSKGVDISHLRVEEGKTAISQVELINGERVFGDYDEGVLENYILTEEDLEFIQKFDVVICDVWGKVEGQFKEMKERGITTAFDCATDPEAEECKTAIPYTDYLFFSTDEGDCAEIRNKMKEIQTKGPKLVICMMGEEGSMCYDGNIFHKFGIVPCEKLVDSMGAGDSYIAGFLKGIIDGKSIENAMKLGASNATETLKYFGAW
ncbi:fructoselysine 6-kinase [Coprococcus comes]|uniref:fructoselysine 6-kinase n=1 Tax=Coprococcus comes TaxID=410072 RepID=UPI00189752CD|nr:fructoselysine 6-kinase [Coprococcus comes]